MTKGTPSSSSAMTRRSPTRGSGSSFCATERSSGTGGERKKHELRRPPYRDVFRPRPDLESYSRATSLGGRPHRRSHPDLALYLPRIPFRAKGQPPVHGGQCGETQGQVGRGSVWGRHRADKGAGPFSGCIFDNAPDLSVRFPFFDSHRPGYGARSLDLRQLSAGFLLAPPRQSRGQTAGQWTAALPYLREGVGLPDIDRPARALPQAGRRVLGLRFPVSGGLVPTLDVLAVRDRPGVRLQDQPEEGTPQ